jgi:hypoxia-inducible factor 1-alpha inhibitor (HIF hydroxylase)
MAEEEKSKFYFDYFFPIEKIPAIDVTETDKIDEFIIKAKPVVIKNTNLVEPACRKWTLNYLKQTLKTSTYHVFRSSSSRFMYWDDKKMNDIKNFKKPSESLKMTFNEFVDLIENQKLENSEYKYYLQQSLNGTVSKEIIEDFTGFNWKWVLEEAKKAKWGTLTSNLLLIGEPANITPVHYDEQENFFAQVDGHKRCLLFSPEMLKCLYPFPVWHPCDRQCMVDLRNPNFDRFPKLKEVKGWEAIVGPGDVLYIPCYWFHQIESLQNITISVNFWFLARSLAGDEITYPLSAEQKNAIMRNIEKMVATAIVNTDELPEFFQTLTLGRYTN